MKYKLLSIAFIVCVLITALSLGALFTSLACIQLHILFFLGMIGMFTTALVLEEDVE